MVKETNRARDLLQVRGVVLDWAGTTVDFGSRAPVAAVCEVFAASGVKLTTDEARGPMGRAKRDHLQAVLCLPRIAARWREVHGREWKEADLDELYQKFLGIQSQCITAGSSVIDGCPEVIATLRAQGLKIGSSTGYTRELMEGVMPRAAEEGYAPDTVVTCSDVSPGRPAPWLIYENAKRLELFPPAAIVKVDDTVAGIEAGQNAGVWCVGVVNSGNEVGLSLEEFNSLTPADRAARIAVAQQRLTAAGSHFLIDTIADLPAAIGEINAKLAAGERP